MRLNVMTPRDVPRTAAEVLMPREKTVVILRFHPVVITWPLLAGLGGLILAVIVSTAGVAEELALVVWIAWLVLMGWVAIKVTNWALDYFIATENRLMLCTGVVDRDVASMPLTKVTDMTYRRTLAGRLFGYGTFVLETAGQNQAFSVVPFVPWPQQMYQEIAALIWPEHAAEKADGGD